jgi:hypothetical protein
MPLVIPSHYGVGSFHFIPVGGVHECIVTLGAHDTAAAGGQDMLDAFVSAWTGTGDFLAAAAMSNEWVFRNLSLLYNNAGSFEVFDALFNRTGTIVSSSMPPNCALLIKKVTGLAGRANRGRMYMPPFSLSEGSIDKLGAMAQAVADVVTSFAQSARTQMIANGHDPVILHHSAATPTPIIDLVCETTIATQRRRLRG